MLSNPIVPIFMVGGIALGSLLEGYLKGKTPPSMEITAGILVVAVLLIIWNLLMYRKALSPQDDKFPESAQSRFGPPITATVCFVSGLMFLFVASLFG